MKLFVYGTLKSKYGNNRLLQGATFLGEAVTVKEYFLGSGGIPYAIPNAPDGKKMLPIMGEVWEINEEHLRRCDNLEGHPSFYTRTTIDVNFLDDGGGSPDVVVPAYIYEMLISSYRGIVPSDTVVYNNTVYYCWNR